MVLSEQKDEVSAFMMFINKIKDIRDIPGQRGPTSMTDFVNSPISASATKTPISQIFDAGNAQMMSVEFPKVEREQDKIIKETMSVFKNPRRVSFTCYLAKYLKFLEERRDQSKKKRSDGDMLTVDVPEKQQPVESKPFFKRLLEPLNIFSTISMIPFTNAGKNNETPGLYQSKDDLYNKAPPMHSDLMSQLTITTPDAVLELNKATSLFERFDPTKIALWTKRLPMIDLNVKESIIASPLTRTTPAIWLARRIEIGSKGPESKAYQELFLVLSSSET